MLNTVKPLRPHCKHSCRAAALLSSVSWLDSRPLLTWNYSNYLQINIKLIQQSNSSVMAASCTSAADISKGVIIILRNKTYLFWLKSIFATILIVFVAAATTISPRVDCVGLIFGDKSRRWVKWLINPRVKCCSPNWAPVGFFLDKNCIFTTC